MGSEAAESGALARPVATPRVLGPGQVTERARIAPNRAGIGWGRSGRSFAWLAWMRVGAAIWALLAVFAAACGSDVVPDGDRADLPAGDHRLSEVRDQIRFPKTSAKRRRAVVEAVRLLVNESHVNLRKYRAAGDDNGMFTRLGDPSRALDALAEDAGAMTDEQFQLALQLIFKQGRDLHFSFFFERPHRCVTSYLPFQLADRFTAGGKPMVTVVAKQPLAIARDAELVRLDAQVGVGDVVLAYDGKAIDELLADRPLIDIESALVRGAHGEIAAALDNINTLGQGSNAGARRYRALQIMTFRANFLAPLPSRDEVELRLRHPDGREETVSFPWLLRVDPSCMRDGDDPDGRATAAVQPAMAFDELSSAYNEFFGTAAGGSVARRDDIVNFDLPFDPKLGLGWGHIDRDLAPGERVSVGYIRLGSFIPAVPLEGDASASDTATIVEYMADRVLQTLHDEHDIAGLIIDVRGNPGGQLGLADRLVQLTSRHPVTPLRYRLRNTDFHRELLAAAVDNGFPWNVTFADDLDSIAGTEKVFGSNLAITSEAEANDVGQRFYGPVAVLTDAGCYSSCDSFSALMQDMEAGKIYGVDPATGAGGANVMPYSTYQRFSAGEMLESIGQEFTVPFRQTIRVRDHAGETLEQTGVAVDQRFVPFLADLASSRDSVLDQVVTELVLAAPRPRVDITRHVVRVPPGATRIFLPVHTFGGIDLVRAFFVTQASDRTLDEEFVGSVDVRDLADSEGVELDLPATARKALSTRGVVRYRVEGVQAQARVFSALFELRAELSPRPAGVIDLSRDLRVATRSHVDRDFGWRVDSDGSLSSHRGDYPSGLHTVAEVAVTPGATALHIRATIDTAGPNDRFSIIVRDAQERELVRRSFSETAKLSGKVLDLSEHLGAGPLTLQFLFITDPFTTGGLTGAAGVRIKSIELR